MIKPNRKQCPVCNALLYYNFEENRYEHKPIQKLKKKCNYKYIEKDR